MRTYWLYFCLTLLCVALSFSPSAVSKSATLILAADMPDIANPVSGRYAELKSLLDKQKEQDNLTFFVFGGGSLGPSAMSVFDRGAHIIDILNSIEPDVMTITKREFSYYEDELSLRAYEAAFPIVTSNVIDNRIESPLDGIANTVMIAKQGVKLGVISVLNNRVIEEYLLTHVQIKDPYNSILSAAAQLKSDGADIVMLHYSYPFEFIPDLLDKRQVDIAFMSDTRLQEKYKEATHSHPRNMSLDVPGIAKIVHLSVDQAIEVTDVHDVVLSQMTADNAVQLQVDSYQLRVNRLLDDRIGYWGTDITTLRSSVRGEENAFANFITDTMRVYTNADMAMINGGIIRGDINYQKNTAITRRNMATELPFRSILITLQVSGQQLVEALEAGLSQAEFLKGGYPHISGFEVTYDLSKPIGERVISVTQNGQPIDSTNMYSLATTDYLAKGGDGYDSLISAPKISNASSESILILDLVTQQIQVVEEVISVTDNRMVEILR